MTLFSVSGKVDPTVLPKSITTHRDCRTNQINEPTYHLTHEPTITICGTFIELLLHTLPKLLTTKKKIMKFPKFNCLSNLPSVSG